MVAEKGIKGKVAIAGASGFLGSELMKFLKKRGVDVMPLPRDQYEAVKEAEIVINLAGESLFGFWSAKKKREIKRSRIETTRKLCASLTSKTKLFISASAVGYYGNRGDEILTEESSTGNGFLADVCEEWEKTVEVPSTTRVVKGRFGIVLSPHGGVLKKMDRGGIIFGSGKQYMSWIALEDFLEALWFIMTNDSLSGPINLTAPEPVTNEEFTKALGKKRIRIPAWVLKLILGEAAKEMFLSSTRAVPAKLESSGFHFQSRNVGEY